MLNANNSHIQVHVLWLINNNTNEFCRFVVNYLWFIDTATYVIKNFFVSILTFVINDIDIQN